MPDLNAALGAFVTARTEWLSATRLAFEDDDRIAAVLLEGSLGRGDGDEWSDLDIVVVVEDAARNKILDGRLEWVAQFGDALFVLDSPWNAPETGAQVNVLYDVEAPMPLYVDWSLWPRTIAAVPTDLRVLVDRPQAPLPAAGVAIDVFRRWPRQQVSAAVRGRPHARFAMLPIIGKCIGRGDGERACRMLIDRGAPGCDPTDRVVQLGALRALISELGADEAPAVVRRLDEMCDFLAPRKSSP
jgi:predicted nucleotidyltransferase